MAIPDYQTIMLPLLKITADQQEHSMRKTTEELAKHFSLTEDEQTELLPSGTQKVFYSRVGWAGTYMKKAGLPRSRVLLDTRLIHDSWRKGCRDERTKARGGFGGGRP